MKKIKLFLLPAIVLTLLLALSSCGTNSAKGVFKKINSTMNSLDSYESEATVTVSVDVQGQKISVSSHTKEVLYELSSKDCYVYSETNARSSFAGNVASYKRIKAYHDGNAFSYANIGGSNQSLYSELSRRDFLKYYQYSQSEFDTSDIYDCENRTFTQSEDGGGWNVQFSGYSQQIIDSYLYAMGLSDYDIDDNVIDMQITLKADSEFRATSMSMKMIFEGDDSGATGSKIESYVRYSSYNSVVPETEDLNTMYYRKVADVRLIDGFAYMIEDIQSKRSDRFTLSVKQDNGQTEYTEESIVRFGKTGGKYYYEIESEINGESYEITYKDGKKTTSKGDKSDTANQTDKAARSFINGLINSANYNALYVDDIVQLDDGRYKVTLDIANIDQYRDLITSSGGSYSGAEQTIYFTVKNKKISKIESDITLGYNGKEIIIKSVVDF